MNNYIKKANNNSIDIKKKEAIRVNNNRHQLWQSKKQDGRSGRNLSINTNIRYFNLIISGITVISYAHSQNNEKPNNSKGLNKQAEIG